MQRREWAYAGAKGAMFKIGDKIECVQPIDNLERGKLYTVVGVEPSSLNGYDHNIVVISINSRHNGWFCWRFKLVNGIERARKVLRSR